MDNLLEAAGLKPKELANDAPLMEKLKASRLGTKELLEDLSNIISTGDTDGVRLKAIETGLKLNPETRQALNDDAGKPVPIVNIIIRDRQSVEVNPILLTRKVIDITNGPRYSQTGPPTTE